MRMVRNCISYSMAVCLCGADPETFAGHLLAAGIEPLSRAIGKDGRITWRRYRTDDIQRFAGRVFTAEDFAKAERRLDPRRRTTSRYRQNKAAKAGQADGPVATITGLKRTKGKTIDQIAQVGRGLIEEGPRREHLGQVAPAMVR